jgi:hypothetical protein
MKEIVGKDGNGTAIKMITTITPTRPISAGDLCGPLDLYPAKMTDSTRLRY